MKAEVIREPEEEEVFEPVTIQVTFHTADELRNLWHRLGAPWHTIREGSSLSDVAEPEDKSSAGLLWDAIDEIITKRELKEPSE